MARTSTRERPDREEVLWPMQKACPACGTPMRLRYDNGRTLVTLAGPVRLRLKIRRCERDDCARHHRPYRPEAEGAIALPEHEFGLDVIALVGRLRHREHRSVPESRLRASSTSPERQSRITHSTSCPTSGCRPSSARITRPWAASRCRNRALSPSVVASSSS